MACTRVIIVNDVCMYKLPTYLHCETVSIPNLPCRCCSIRSRGCRPAAKDAPRRREVAAAALGGDAGEAGPAKPHWVDRTCRAEFATRSPAGEEETGATHWRCCCCCCRRSRRRGCMPDPRLHRAWLASRPAIGDRHALCTSWLDGCSTRLLPDRLWPFSWFPPSSSIEMRKWHLMKVLSLSLSLRVGSFMGRRSRRVYVYRRAQYPPPETTWHRFSYSPHPYAINKTSSTTSYSLSPPILLLAAISGADR